MLQFRWFVRRVRSRNLMQSWEEKVLQMREWMPAMIDPDSGWVDVPTVHEKDTQPVAKKKGK
jgi:hypothetical protein